MKTFDTITGFIDSATKGAERVISARNPKAADVVDQANKNAGAQTPGAPQTNWTPFIIIGAVVVGALVLFGLLKK